MKQSVKDTDLFKTYTELNQLMTNYILFLNGGPSVMVLYDNLVQMDLLIKKLEEAKEITEKGKHNLIEFFADESATSVSL